MESRAAVYESIFHRAADVGRTLEARTMPYAPANLILSHYILRARGLLTRSQAKTGPTSFFVLKTPEEAALKTPEEAAHPTDHRQAGLHPPHDHVASMATRDPKKDNL